MNAPKYPRAKKMRFVIKMTFAQPVDAEHIRKIVQDQVEGYDDCTVRVYHASARNMKNNRGRGAPPRARS